MLTIGLTGGIGSGKSAASSAFESLGVTVVDADIVAREVVEPGTEALSHIGEHFGQDVITSSGELNRASLRALIFSDPEHKNWLEALLHPIIRQEIVSQLAQSKSEYSILVSPLLFETDQHLLVERTLLIDVPRALQIERAANRDNNSREQIEAIIAQQMSRECKIERADDIILNDKDLASLEREVSKFHSHYLELANARKTRR